MSETPRYRLTQLLGKGAMGEVMRADDVRLEREVAVKRIDARLEAQASANERFVAEARITARLDHPGIVPIYSLEHAVDGALSYAMKLVRGRTLGDYLSEARAAYSNGGRPAGELTLESRLEVFLHVLDTVAYAHERGYLHRDLKPDNIMVSAFGEVHVMDWGLARAIGPSAETEASQGDVVGTLAFMSPEQAAGQSDGLDARSDLFSLGLVLFELVTLREARSGGTFDDVVRMAMAGRKNPIRHRESHVKIARGLVAIITRATAPVRADRYARVLDFADDLRRFLRDESLQAEPDRGLRKLLRWIGHHRTQTLVSGVVLVLVAVLVIVALQWRAAEAVRARDEAERQREHQLQGVQAVVTAQASRMNERLHDFEGLLRGLGADAAQVLAEPAPPLLLPIYTYVANRSEPPTAPAGAHPSPIYHLPVSYTEPDIALFSAGDRSAATPTAARLARLLPALRRTVLESGRSDAVKMSGAEQEALVMQVGVPLVWAYVATEDGLSIGYPGSWIYAPNDGLTTYDPRITSWYRAVPRDDARSKWINSGIDENGLGLLVTCVRAVHAANGAVLGVAAVDVTFEYFITNLLEVAALVRAGAEAFVVDADGLVVVRSSDSAIARDPQHYAPTPLPDAELRAALASRRQGHVRRPAGQLALWAPVVSTGWTYLVVGPEQALLAATE